MGSQKRATLQEIAKACGVSKATVSMALRGVGNISSERVKDIRKVARDMNYRPALAAQMLRKQDSDYIGILMPHDAGAVVGSGFSSPILAHFINICEKQGQKYHVEFMQSTPGSCFIPPAQMTGGMVSGTLVAGHGGNEFNDWLENECSTPWVRIDEPGEFCVVSRIDSAMEQLVDSLAGLGHERICFIGGPIYYTSHRLGYEGFLKATKRNGMQASSNVGERVFAEDYSYEEGVRWIVDKLSARNRPTAIICMGIFEARLTCQLAVECELRVPDDLSVVGFGPPGAGANNWPQISCLEPDYNVMVEQALRMLRCRLGGQLVSSDLWETPVNIVDRASVAVAP